MNQVAKDRIAENKKEKNTSLDLSELELTHIPSEIKDFVWLERLSLSQNQISSIAGLDELTQLQELYLYQNQISSITGLDELTQLQVLSLHQNQISSIVGLDELTQLQELYLYQNQISSITGLDELTQLQILNLSQNQIPSIGGLDQLTQLQELYLSQNQISSIAGLDQLTQLQVLDLSQNQISSIAGLDQLTQLQLLYLSQNQISSIAGLDQLTQLQLLNLEQNQISSIASLDQLTQLQVLDLSQNQISSIAGLDQLTQLQLLYLSQNQISSIAGLDQLTQLQVLHLSQNQISSIAGLDQLTQLQFLHLDQNQISSIAGLDQLTQLQLLYLYQNQISSIAGLDKLASLKTLDLSGTLIQDITPLYQWLQKKQEGVFWENVSSRWETAPAEDELYSSLEFDLGLIGKQFHISKKGLFLKDCDHLKVPSPEWIQQGRKVVLDYLSAALKQGTVEMNEAKVMIVGRPHAGKTSASIKLRDADGELPVSTGSTRGIEVKDWVYEKNNKQYTAHLWDFGGQDVQYAIHQFFMTQRAIYLLLDCTRDPEQGETNSEFISNYWLETIRNLAKSSPTFYLCNLYASYGNNLSAFKSFEREYGDFLHKYPFETNLHQVSKTNEKGIVPLREKLQEAIANLPNVGIVLPKKWAAVKKILTDKAVDQAHISLKEFLAICQSNGITDQKSAILISRYFHEIGSVIHYSDDNTSPLYKLIILNRKWATDATYQVILDGPIREEKYGKFTKKDLQRIWTAQDYQSMTAELLGLLQEFEICYELPDSKPKTYLIPQCLPYQYPDGFDEHLEKPLSIRYNYGFLPYGIVNRLTVRLHQHILDNKVWKQGVVLQKDNGRVLVEEVKTINKGYIEITVSGNQADRWLLQKKIMDEIDELNKGFNLEDRVAIQVPCTCEHCKDKTEPFLHDYKKLIGKLKVQKNKEGCGITPYEDVSILDLIDHAFFNRPEAVEQSLKAKLDLRGAHIDKLVVGDHNEKNQTITASGGATVQVTETGEQNIAQTSGPTNSKTNLLEYFRVRKLIGWAVVAIAAGIVAYNFPPIQAWSGLVFVALLGWGVYISLTADSKYLRYARWVLLVGLGAAGVLNGLPVIAGNFIGQVGSTEGSFIQLLGEYKMDEQPLITIVILLSTFGLAAFLVHKDHAGD